jgi:hypothetical protein
LSKLANRGTRDATVGMGSNKVFVGSSSGYAEHHGT